MRRWLPAVALAGVLLVVLELAVFVAVSLRWGLGWALAGTVVTSLLGGWLLRRAGTRTWRAVFRPAAASAGTRPGPDMVRMAAGVLLLAPGFVTDLVGLVLIVPPLPRLLSDVLRDRIPSSLLGQAAPSRTVRAKVRRRPPSPADDIIEGDIVE